MVIEFHRITVSFELMGAEGRVTLNMCAMATLWGIATISVYIHGYKDIDLKLIST